MLEDKPAATPGHQACRRDPASLDLGKFARIVGLLGSDHEGERSNAVTLGGRMLQTAGMRWEDFIEAYRRAEIATEAAARLLDENAALKAENDQLRSAGTAVALWNDVGAKASDTCRAAQWALDLRRRGDVWLSDFEVGFLRNCTTWTGRLTPRMAPVFQRLMDRIVERTGLTPP
jgi:hypothetical protein